MINTVSMMEITTNIYLGDSREQLKLLPDNSVDLVITSPPYADQRKNTYGGIRHDEYVEWFLPISEQLLRVLKLIGALWFLARIPLCDFGSN